MFKIFRDKDIVQDIIHLVGYMVLLSTIVVLITPVVKGWSILISLMVLILFILAFAWHTFIAVIRIYEPTFTITIDKNHDVRKRGIKDFLLVLLFPVLIAFIFLMCVKVVNISIGISQV
jgi:hypothetical protein